MSTVSSPKYPEINILTSMKNYIEYKINDSDDGTDVLSILKGQFHFSSKKIKSVKFAEEGILVDGLRVTVRQKLHAGQVLKVLMDDSDKRTDKIYGVQMPLDIVYEDEYYIVLNKPAGVVCHPSQGHYFDSLANGLRWYLDSKGESSGLHLCGRLDKDTSGLVLFAKNGAAEYEIKRLKEAGEFTKIYMAIVEGIFEEKQGTIDIPMIAVRNEQGMLMMSRAVEENDKTRAMTRYEVIDERKNRGIVNHEILDERKYFSLIRVSIDTGRMHQIRFHMSTVGHPLVGDPVYGSGRKSDIRRTALHAGRIKFMHPYKDMEISLAADLPEDMRMCLGNYSWIQKPRESLGSGS